MFVILTKDTASLYAGILLGWQQCTTFVEVTSIDPALLVKTSIPAFVVSSIRSKVVDVV